MSLPVPAASTERALPDLARFRRPRLRDDVPILWRGSDSIQVGDDVILDRITRSHVAWLTSLDGLASPEDIEESLTIPEHDARRIVRALLVAGAIDDAARIPTAVRWAAQRDRDAVAGRFGAALRTYRDLEATYDAVEARGRCAVAVVGDGPLADAVERAMAAAGLERADAGGATLTVLADAPHPDVPAHLGHDLPARPHLHVGALGDRAVIGPLVVPGRTPCLRCTHLHRRDADPAWPLLAVQWSQAVRAMACPPQDPILMQVAAAHAALLVRRWTDTPDDPDSWSGHALELHLPDGLPVRVARPAHPLCGCAWPQDPGE